MNENKSSFLVTTQSIGSLFATAIGSSLQTQFKDFFFFSLLWFIINYSWWMCQESLRACSSCQGSVPAVTSNSSTEKCC